MEQSKWASTSAVAAQPIASPPRPQPAETRESPPKSVPASLSSSFVQTDPVVQYSSAPLVDEFAQTRPPDDLFSDDFEPVDEPFVVDQVLPVHPALIQSKPQRRQNGQTQVTGVEAPRKETAAVRGDRSGTGGMRRTKLTEEELTARMEAIRLKNQSLEAAHARAAADEESFKQREAEAQTKRKVERHNRQQLMSEREKNRLRKMNAQGGRQWDAEKEDPTTPAGRGGQFRRGAHGGVVVGGRPAVGDRIQLSDYVVDEDGSRGRGKGQARGPGRLPSAQTREGHGGSTIAPKSLAQSVPITTDFPSLPAADKLAVNTTPVTKFSFPTLTTLPKRVSPPAASPSDETELSKAAAIKGPLPTTSKTSSPVVTAPGVKKYTAARVSPSASKPTSTVATSKPAVKKSWADEMENSAAGPAVART